MLEKFTEILSSRRFWQVFVIALFQLAFSLGWISGETAEAFKQFFTLVLGASVTMDTVDKFASKIGK